jgi:hypothetical protein
MILEELRRLCVKLVLCFKCMHPRDIEETLCAECKGGEHDG